VLRLDHLFVCVSPQRPEIDQMRALGFASLFERTHPGQGTANGLVLFENNYLEFLYLRDREEAQTNALRLDRRADHRQSGASPFGVALRGDHRNLGARAWRPYQLEGMSGLIHILERSVAEPELPMVFCFDDDEPDSGGPRRWGLGPEHFTHGCRARTIVDVELTGPGYEALAELEFPGEVRFAPGESANMSLRLDHGPRDARVGELLDLSSV
jgi:hypothetical protein